MITPSKHMNLEVSVLRIGVLLLKNLSRFGIMSMDEVLRCVEKFAGKDGVIMLSPSMSFLYLLGKIKYHQQTDSIEFLRTQKDV